MRLSVGSAMYCGRIADPYIHVTGGKCRGRSKTGWIAGNVERTGPRQPGTKACGLTRGRFVSSSGFPTVVHDDD